MSRGGNTTERKVISISVKRQLTIPQKYFEALGFDNEAECYLQDDGIFIRPLRDTGGSVFSEQILADLIYQGYSGQDLLDKFKEYTKAVRPAVLKLIEETDSFAKSGEGKMTFDELFRSEE